MGFSGSNRRGPVSSSPTWHRREPPEWPKASVRVWDGRAYSGAEWRTQASADRASLEESGSQPELSLGEISPVNPPSAIAVSIRPSLPFLRGSILETQFSAAWLLVRVLQRETST